MNVIDVLSTGPWAAASLSALLVKIVTPLDITDALSKLHSLHWSLE